MRTKEILIGLIICLYGNLKVESKALAYYDSVFYNCFIENKMDKWLPVIEELQTVYKMKQDIQYLLKATEGLYGYVGYALGNDIDKNLFPLLEKGEKNIEVMLIENDKWAEVIAFRSAFYGFRVGLQPWKAMYYGPLSIEAIGQVKEDVNKNIQVTLETANVRYYTPTLFGGSKEEGIAYYEKVIQLMEVNKKTYHNWMYLSSHTLLAMAYEETGKPDKAKAVYQKILRIEPNYVWIKNKVYPDFLKRNQLNEETL